MPPRQPETFHVPMDLDEHGNPDMSKGVNMESLKKVVMDKQMEKMKKMKKGQPIEDPDEL